MRSSLDMWSALVGFFLPVLVAKIQSEKWRNEVRIAVGIAACAVAALVTAYFQNKLNLHNFSESVITIFLMTKASYIAVWKPSGVTKTLERNTSPNVP